MGSTLDNPEDRYFNRDAFLRPADNIGRFGSAGVGILEGPGTQVFSMTVGKAFATGGVSRLRFEVAFSNLFNLENLGVPNMNVTSSAFGRITSTQTVDQAGPRTVQVSLRYPSDQHQLAPIALGRRPAAAVDIMRQTDSIRISSHSAWCTRSSYHWSSLSATSGGPSRDFRSFSASSPARRRYETRTP